MMGVSPLDTIRVVIADDHPVVRSGLTALLATMPGIEVVAQAADGAATVREVVVHRPEVVVLDLRMPVLDGIAVAQRLAVEAPETRVLVLTMFDDDTLVADALDAGVAGYLLKGASGEELERAIRAVATGSAILSERVVAAALRLRTPAPPPFPALTAREREILDLIAAGRSNAAIGTLLGIAPKTVGNHISAIFLKLAVSTRAEAIVRARDAGLGR